VKKLPKPTRQELLKYEIQHLQNQVLFPGEILEALETAKEEMNGLTQRNKTPLYIFSEKGRENLVNLILKYCGQECVDTVTREDWTPLHIASENGHLGVVKALIQMGSNMNHQNRQGMTPLRVAAGKGEYSVVQELIRAKADLKIPSLPVGFSPLLIAAHNGHLKVVQALVEADADIEIRTHEGFTPLAQAIYQMRLDVVEYLIEQGANPLSTGNDGRTCFFLAEHPANTVSWDNKEAILKIVRDYIEFYKKKHAIPDVSFEGSNKN
jgi:serine/threonine-protein phosphatase 6 regulatory ankyrin repeat subunit B